MSKLRRYFLTETLYYPDIQEEQRDEIDTKMPSITLWFLQASRSIRIAWLLEELGLDYEVRFFDRTPQSKAPAEFKAGSGHPLGKAPTIKDGDLTVHESGAITEYVKHNIVAELKGLKYE